MLRSLALAGLLSAALAAGAAAQTLTTPVFLSPYRAFQHNELSGAISDPGSGISVALEGAYRFARSRYDLGLHAGILDGSGASKSVFALGADGRLSLSRHSQQFPLDVAGTLGFGALFSDGNSGFLIPFGVTLGRQLLLEDSNISFVPYVHPVIAPTFGDLSNGTQFGLGLGVDVALNKTFDIRVSGAVGDYEGVGIGLAWHR
jgi:hypothetical protein